MIDVSKEAVRRMSLWKQGLYHPSTRSTAGEALALLKQLGCVQLDTMSVLTRSQHLIFWSRMQTFEERWLLDFYRQSAIFELYLHALCILPMEEYAYSQPLHTARIASYIDQDAPDTKRLKTDLLQLLEAEGTVNGKVISEKLGLDRPKVETWTRTPVRKALDELWRVGAIGVTRDKNFQKVYHRLTDQIPAEQLTLGEQVTAEETYRRYTLLALQAMGVASEADVSDYFRFRREVVQKVLDDLLAAGTVREVKVEGEDVPYYATQEDLELLQTPELQAEPTHCTLLSPFDNLIWFRPRLEKLFGVHYRLESYFPEEKRVYGYFALPILLRGKIIGTIDLKAERKRKRLVIHRLVLFGTGLLEDAQATDLACVLRRLLAFLKLEQVEAIAEQEGEEAVRLLLQKIGEQESGADTKVSL